MNVKISYTVDFEKVPETVTDLIRQASNNLQVVGESLKGNSFDQDEDSVLEKMKRIDAVRKKLASIDFLLEDCYTILAGYNRALAEMHMPKQQTEEPQHERIQQRGSSDGPTEGSNDALRGG